MTVNAFLFSSRFPERFKGDSLGHLVNWRAIRLTRHQGTLDLILELSDSLYH